MHCLAGQSPITEAPRLLDDNKDSSAQRGQLISMLMIVVLLVGGSYFLFPAPPAQVPSAPASTAEIPPGSPAQSNPADSLPVAPKAEQTSALIPPASADENPELDEVVFRNDYLELVFTRIGARLKRATVLLGKDGRDSVQLVPIWRDTPDSKAVYPLGLRFGDPRFGDALDARRWDVVQDAAAGTVTFQLEVPGLARLEKVFRMGDAPYVLQMSVNYTNLESVAQVWGTDIAKPAYSVNWGPNVNSEDVAKGVNQEVIWEKEGQHLRYPTAKFKPPATPDGFTERAFDVNWMAIRSAYFVVGMKPDFPDAQGWIFGGPKHFRIGAGVGKMEVPSGGSDARSFQLYLGPNKGKLLAQAWPELASVWEFFTSVKIMDQFAKFLLNVLNWFHDHVIANYGFAIIFLTILVRAVMLPLTLKSMKNMKKMQKLAPEIEAIKAEIGDNQQELQRRMMEMYRERGISPLGGCFPLLLQMPVFIALYRMLWSAVELRRAPFLFWMQDMSQPDQLFMLPWAIPIPFTSTPLQSLNLLPILMGVAMIVSQKLMPASGPVQNQQQKMMMTIMPVFFSVICYNVASGLNLYILVSTVLGIAQNYIMPTGDVSVAPRKRLLSRSKHFYTAAQARKRQMAKEVRKEKKAKLRHPEGKKGDSGKN